ncbi:hypothetical protein H5368_11060 [Luteimonas sp. MC1782]|uniref:hypothetical protein n=1 Tax=Luteimonas sp. MC1782 TaxID=2760305 RepID=UPI00160164E3|nr:hypothetical protein [Luteimonas sp. MC1782]MBB1473576.1 hypothetical protein [Luteimonas sp. MC1782]
MSFDKLLAKVEQAEDALEARERQVAADFRVLGSTWRETLTPTRIVIAGALAGFLVGRARPVHAAGAIGGGSARWLQMASSVAGLVGALQAKFAAEGAESAAKGAEAEVAAAAGSPDGVTEAAAAAPLSPSERRYSADPAWDGPPVPAEAATDVSERR